jgi:hypothetical protein
VFDKRIRTSVRNKCTRVKTATFSGRFCQNFQPNPDRISTESSLSVKPNLDRISESLSLTFEPNPNRISKSVKDFILLAACSLGVRCRICELVLVGCWGLLVSSGQPERGHLSSCPRCIGGSKGLSLEPAWHAFYSLLRTDLFLFFFRHAWLLVFAQSLSGESHSGMRLWSAFHNLGRVLHTRRPPSFFAFSGNFPSKKGPPCFSNSLFQPNHPP